VAGYQAHRGWYHTTAFGQHLVCGGVDGNLYTLSDAIFSDAGAPIRRERTYPHMSKEQGRIYYGNLDLLAEKGVGPEPPLLDGQGNPRGPEIMMQYSNDGGRTWGPERWQTAGEAGEFRTLIRWTRNGMARDRVFRVVVTDPVYWSLIDCYIDLQQGTS
jgi:hypothetical protein